MHKQTSQIPIDVSNVGGGAAARANSRAGVDTVNVNKVVMRANREIPNGLCAHIIQNLIIVETSKYKSYSHKEKKE